MSRALPTDAASLVREMADWLDESAHRLDQEAVARLRALADVLNELIANWQGHKAHAHVIECWGCEHCFADHRFYAAMEKLSPRVGASGG